MTREEYLKYHKEYRERNRERRRAKIKEWCINNREQKLKTNKNWYEKTKHITKEKYEAKRKQWRELNKDKLKSYKSARRARKLNAEGTFTDKEWQELCKRYENKCACCRETKKLTADHIVPLFVGGTNWISNIQPLCLSCNDSKGTKDTRYEMAT